VLAAGGVRRWPLAQQPSGVLQAELNKVVDRYASTPTGTPVPLFV